MDPQRNYQVSFSDFSERHYVRNFAKKHKSNWARTSATIVDLCQRIDNLLASGRQQVDLIKAVSDHKLVKLDFAIHGSRKSPKGSGNRAILWVNESDRKVTILMVYSKNDVKGKKETVWWQKQIRDNCSDVYEMLWS